MVANTQVTGRPRIKIGLLGESEHKNTSEWFWPVRESARVWIEGIEGSSEDGAVAEAVLLDHSEGEAMQVAVFPPTCGHQDEHESIATGRWEAIRNALIAEVGTEPDYDDEGATGWLMMCAYKLGLVIVHEASVREGGG